MRLRRRLQVTACKDSVACARSTSEQAHLLIDITGVVGVQLGQQSELARILQDGIALGSCDSRHCECVWVYSV